MLMKTYFSKCSSSRLEKYCRLIETILMERTLKWGYKNQKDFWRAA